VRRMRLRDGLSISEIARRTSLSRNTIKGWLRGPVRTAMTYRRSAAPMNRPGIARGRIM
jgi:transcriptional regulator with XRE-family HTH domain